jgi:hypothetical protein
VSYHASHVDIPPPVQAEIVAGILGIIALFALRGFFLRLRRDRLVADTPLMRIRSAAQGYVKVAGRTAPAGPAPTAAPLSSRPCVWWSYEVAYKETDSRGNTKWTITETAASTELFVVSDGDAQCLVGPVRAEITPTANDTWYGLNSRPNGPPITSIRGDWRYTEKLLGVGVQVSVMGELRSHSEVTGVEAATAAKLREWKQDQHTLLARFDNNHNGRIDPSEWEVVRAAAAKESQAESLHAAIPRTSVISQPRNGEPFLVAPLTSKGLELRERLFAMGYFAVGIVSVILCALAIRHAHTLSHPESPPEPYQVTR